MKLLIFFFIALFCLTSCKLSQESKLYADKSASSEVFIKLEPATAQKMNSVSSSDPKVHGKKITELPNEWISFEQLGLNDSLHLSGDTAAILKKIYIKYLIENGQFLGFGMKADRLQGTELEKFGNLFNNLNPGKKLDSLKPTNAIDPKADWDGKKLTLQIGSGKSTKKTVSHTSEKKDEDKNFDMVTSLLKETNVIYTFKFDFEKKISKIKGKHDFFKKVNDHSVIYEIDFKKLLELAKSGKPLHKKDSEIVVITE